LTLIVMLLSACTLTSARQFGDTVALDNAITQTPAAVTRTTAPTITTRQVPTVQAATRTNAAAPTRIPPTAVSQFIAGCTPRVAWSVYTVVPGDTLANIAARVNSTVNELAAANCLAD